MSATIQYRKHIIYMVENDLFKNVHCFISYQRFGNRHELFLSIIKNKPRVLSSEHDNIILNS